MSLPVHDVRLLDFLVQFSQTLTPRRTRSVLSSFLTPRGNITMISYLQKQFITSTVHEKEFQQVILFQMALFCIVAGHKGFIVCIGECD